MKYLALLLLSGCVIPWGEGPHKAGVYPHAKDYAALAAHGADAVADPTRCVSCHEAGAPSCDSCHVNYPHQRPITATHAPAEATCADCHGVVGAHAEADAACNSCHTTYPHAVGWIAGSAHGDAAIARQLPEVVCGNCHGADLAGRGAAAGCADCHTAWPHPAGWDHGATAATDPSACVACHGDAVADGPVSVRCDSCHLAIPHPADWSARGHLEAAGRLGEGTCLQCHESGDGPAEMPATCGSRCHGGAP